ncbi:MAG: hypothetical protein L0H15_10310, partial [Nitrosospira sp.]|nr:hypothetical protein [Nitrosospira sp.]
MNIKECCAALMRPLQKSCVPVLYLQQGARQFMKHPVHIKKACGTNRGRSLETRNQPLRETMTTT